VVVKRPMNLAANAADCFFSRRVSRIMRALGSPKTPLTTVLGENPGKRYVSWSRRRNCIYKSCHVSSGLKTHKTHGQQGSHENYMHYLPTSFGEDPKLI
jgi:hypothetical protein